MTVIGELLVDLGLGATTAATVESVLLFVLAFVALYLIGTTAVKPSVDRLLGTRGLDRKARRPLVRVAWYGFLFVAVALAFGIAGFGNFLTAFATIAAAATLAIGFALQDVIKNFVSGLFILTDRPFQIGDWIEWDGNAGIVEDISLRVSRVRTFDNELLTVPNSELTENVVKNPVAYDTLRQRFTFGIGYDDDVHEATEIIIEEASAHPDILDEPEPSVRLTELGDSDVGLQSRYWIADPARSDFVRIRGEYVTAVKERFDEQGIDIPYPVRTLDGELAIQEAALGERAAQD